MNTVKFQLDPTGHYQEMGVETNRLIPVAGLLPSFIQAVPEDQDLEEGVLEQYGMGGSPFEGFEVKPDGSMEYSGDPVMYPILKATRPEDGQQVFIYEDAWIRFSKTGNVYRMD